MPVIRVTDETLERLKTWAEPLVDTAESALAKALDAAEQARKLPSRDYPTPAAKPSRPRRRRHASEKKLPQKAFRKPLLELLYELGGSAQVADLQPLMKERMASNLLPGDRQPVSTGDERWWNATCWERSNLVKEGYLRDDSPRGTWELSERGTESVAGSSSKSPNPFVEHLLSIPDVGDDADFDRDRSAPRRVEL
ncbi:MAG: hypothetical protein OXG51_03545 [Gammaproteobacteria bacterium]|nr:hypothetical protein [Gammaproteobacteria bacterium]